MKKNAVIWGFISGFIAVANTAITTPLVLSNRIGFDEGEIFGYTVIVLSCVVMFFGIRSYRESSGGTVTFGRAFLAGLLIALISSVIYVVAWEIVSHRFFPDFWERYAAYTLDKMRAKGETAAAIAAKQQELVNFKKLYDNPLLNALFTFLEPFPIQLVAALISAAILRRKTPQLQTA